MTEIVITGIEEDPTQSNSQNTAFSVLEEHIGATKAEIENVWVEASGNSVFEINRMRSCRVLVYFNDFGFYSE